MSISATPQNSCFVCLLKSKYDLLLLAFFVVGLCEHSKLRYSPNPEYRLSKFLFVTVIFFSLSHLIVTLSYIFFLPDLCKIDNFLCLIMVSDQTFSATTLLVILIYLFYGKIQTLEFGSWAKIFEKRLDFGCSNIIADKEAAQLKKYRDIMAFFNFTSALGYFAANHFANYDHYQWSTARKFSIITCYNFQGYIVYYLSQRIRIVGGLLRTINTDLKFALASKSVILETFLRQKSKLILAVNSSLSLLMRYITYVLMTWCFSTVICLILNIYTYIQYGNYDFYTLALIECRTLGTILQYVVLFSYVDSSLSKAVSKTLFKLFLIYNYYVKCYMQGKNINILIKNDGRQPRDEMMRDAFLYFKNEN